MKNRLSILKTALALILAISLSGCGIGSSVEGSMEPRESSDTKDADALEQEKADEAEDPSKEQNNTDSSDISEDDKSDSPVYMIASKTVSKEYDGDKKFTDPELDNSKGILFEGEYVNVIMADGYADKYAALYEALKSRAKKRMEEDDKRASDVAEDIKTEYEQAIDEGYGFIGPYWYREGARIARTDDTVLSMVLSSDEFWGGFHNDYNEIGLTYDVASGKELNLNDVVKCTEEELNKIVAEKLHASAEDDNQFGDLEESLSHYKFDPKPGADDEDYEKSEFPYNWYLAGDGLHIVFNAYDIAAYVYGASDVSIGYEEYDGIIDEKYYPDKTKGYILPLRTFLYSDEDSIEGDGIKLSCSYNNDNLKANSLTVHIEGKSATIEKTFSVKEDYNQYYRVHKSDGSEFLYIIIWEPDDCYDLFIFEVTGDVPKAVSVETYKRNKEDYEDGFFLYKAFTDPDIEYAEQTGDMLIDQADESMEYDGQDSSVATEGDYLALYNELLQKMVSGEILMGDEAEVFEYSYAQNPGYAIYDADKDGRDELFVTAYIDNQWHAYTIYYIKDGEVTSGGTYTGYMPSENLWINGFEYAVDAYTFDSKEGQKRVWQILYPVDDDEGVSTITYEGQEPQEISDSEESAIFSKEILEPADIQWNKFDKDTDLTK